MNFTKILGLTKKQTIKKHREMWNRIADETERDGEICDKEYALEILRAEQKGYLDGVQSRGTYPLNYCWCCEYVDQLPGGYVECYKRCPIRFIPERLEKEYYTPTKHCIVKESPYSQWLNEKDPKKSAALARIIAALPERDDSRVKIMPLNER